VDALREQVRLLQDELRREHERPGVLVSQEAQRLLSRTAEARGITIAQLVEEYAWGL
jgi:hypothetical protein